MKFSFNVLRSLKGNGSAILRQPAEWAEQAPIHATNLSNNVGTMSLNNSSFSKMTGYNRSETVAVASQYPSGLAWGCKNLATIERKIQHDKSI